MIKRSDQSGFTVIELLITLFIAVAFLVSGYQLYSVIIKDGGETRASAKATNTTNEYLQRYKSNAVNPCVAQTPLNDKPINVSGLSNVKISVKITCPYPSTPSISKVKSTIKYGLDETSSSIASFVKPVDSAVPPTNTTGLVGWWTFNGDAVDQSGNGNDGTVNGATPTTDRNGINNRAFSFDGLNDYIITPDVKYDPIFSFSFWFKTTTASGGAYQYMFSHGDVSATQSFNVWLDEASIGSFPTLKTRQFNSSLVDVNANVNYFDNKWHLYTAVFEGANLSIYVNGSLLANGSTPTGGIDPSTGIYFGGREDLNADRFFPGYMDDARIYNRALSAAEVTDLYNGGAY